MVTTSTSKTIRVNEYMFSLFLFPVIMFCRSPRLPNQEVNLRCFSMEFPMCLPLSDEVGKKSTRKKNTAKTH
jgi:hypothetical protein